MPIVVTSTPEWTLQGVNAMALIDKLNKATGGRVIAGFDFANSTNSWPEDKPFWTQIGSAGKTGLLKDWPQPPNEPTLELRRRFEEVLMPTKWWSHYKSQVVGGVKTKCQDSSARRCIIFVVPGGPISQAEARHMASIIENVDIKGETKPEFVIVKGDLAELGFVETGMQVDLHIAIQPPPCVIGARATQRRRN